MESVLAFLGWGVLLVIATRWSWVLWLQDKTFLHSWTLGSVSTCRALPSRVLITIHSSRLPIAGCSSAHPWWLLVWRKRKVPARRRSQRLFTSRGLLLYAHRHCWVLHDWVRDWCLASQVTREELLTHHAFFLWICAIEWGIWLYFLSCDPNLVLIVLWWGLSDNLLHLDWPCKVGCLLYLPISC